MRAAGRGLRVDVAQDRVKKCIAYVESGVPVYSIVNLVDAMGSASSIWSTSIQNSATGVPKPATFGLAVVIAA